MDRWPYKLILLLTLIIGCRQPETEPDQSLSSEQAVRLQALNQIISPITDADPNRDFADLSVLDTLLVTVQLVGMGEATHGTHEFFLMKDRLFRYLVQKHGFRCLAFEMSYGGSLAINRYIHGQPSPFKSATNAVQSLVDLGYAVWNTAEVRDLIEWMRQYNSQKAATEQLSFYGVDCQTASDTYPIITDFVTRVNPEVLGQVAEFYHKPQSISGVYDLFVNNEAKWVAAGGRLDYELAKHAARVLVQQQDLTSNGGCLRDQYMAENAQWLLTTFPATKISLWAHNHHIGNWSAYCNRPMMGAYLKQQLKDRYLIIGTSFSQGTFKAYNTTGPRSFQDFSFDSQSTPNSFNYLFGKTEPVNFVLKLNRPLLPDQLSRWLSSEQSLFEPGGTYDPSKPDYYYVPSSAKGRYDVLIHFRNTTPSQSLP